MSDYDYCGIPFRFGGRDRSAGLDCAGLAALWLRSELGIDVGVPPSAAGRAEDYVQDYFNAENLRRGDLVFFREEKTGEVRHVAVHLGGLRLLHTLNGCESRIDNGFTLLARLGMKPYGVLRPEDAAAALADPKLGWTQVVLLIVSVALSFAASALNKPRAPRFRNESGRYGFDSLITRVSSELPLPDVFGKVALAGNSPYQTQIDKKRTVTDATLQKANKVIVFNSGPCEDIQITDVHVNGLPYNDGYYNSDGGTDSRGFYPNPAQTKAEAVEGFIGLEMNRSSFTIYKGAHDITVPVDIRAQYDRTFPIYGFSGCTYIVFRLINSTKFTTFNVIAIIKGRKCRTFTTTGFTVNTVTGESLAGANGTKVRFKLANDDIKAVTALTVNGTTYSQITAAAQTGNVYHLNKLKGYVEFLTAPANGATISINYQYYPRAWTENPASHLVYLLTEKTRGLGKDESRVNWPAAVALRDYCDANVTWADPDGTFTGPRYKASYAIDVRKGILDHLRAVLDACYSYLFMSNGKYVMKARKSESSVFSFNDSNIAVDVSAAQRRSTFRSQMVTRSERANRVNVFYHSADTYNAEDGVVRDDRVDQANREANGNEGVVEETLKLLAIDSKTQAERFGETVLRENVNMKWIAEWKTTIKGIALEPGDVVDVTHSSQPGWSQKLFRIEQISYDPLDRMVIRASEYFGGAYI